MKERRGREVRNHGGDIEGLSARRSLVIGQAMAMEVVWFGYGPEAQYKW
jgi:hypothetical protein